MYLDSAILVKLVVREPDSEIYADLVDGQVQVHASELAITECRSALLRKRQQGEIAVAEQEGAWLRLESCWSGKCGLVLCPVSRAILIDAGDIMQRCVGRRIPLRTLDAIHVATCLRMHAQPLVTSDTVMRSAAQLLGMALYPPGPVS
jgi:predicted nucleic acid-binding protein